MFYFYLIVSNLFVFFVAKWIGENKYRVSRQKLEERREDNLKVMGQAILNNQFRTMCPDCLQDTTKKMKYSLRKMKDKASIA